MTQVLERVDETDVCRGAGRAAPRRARARTGVITTVLVVLTTVAVGCSSEQAGGEASCVLAMRHEAETYYAYKTEKPVEPGRPLGEVGYALCDDTGGQVTDDPALAAEEAARFSAYAIDGVDPADAFVVPSGFRRYLFFSGSADGTGMPPEVERLLSH